MSLELYINITYLLNLTQIYAVLAEDELLFMKNINKVVTEILSVFLYNNDQTALNQIREAYHNIINELEAAIPL
jgi:F0F1-type ATP synthase delta subunit